MTDEERKKRAALWRSEEGWKVDLENAQKEREKENSPFRTTHEMIEEAHQINKNRYVGDFYKEPEDIDDPLRMGPYGPWRETGICPRCEKELAGSSHAVNGESGELMCASYLFDPIASEVAESYEEERREELKRRAADDKRIWDAATTRIK